MPAEDVVIVGGGVIGLSIAYRLALEGASVTLLERGRLGAEASWAGAGLLPAHTERLDTNPTVALRSWSAVLYPEWSVALREATGLDNGYRRCGGVDVALTDAEDQELRASAGRWRAERIVFERLAPDDFRRVEPALGPGLRSAYFLPDRAQVRNPRHLKALARAARDLEARLLPGCAVLGFATRGDRVTAVRTTAGDFPCGAAVVAAGAWTGALAAGLGVDAPTPPCKGQIVLFGPGRPLLKRVVEHGSNYLVPRDDGRVLAGATEEDAGFDSRPTAAGFEALTAEARRLCPALADAHVEATWAGLRPGSLDTKPYLGPLPGFANLYLAAGHKRSGLQLSPATAEVMAALVMGRTPGIDLTPFRIGREPAAFEAESFRS